MTVVLVAGVERLCYVAGVEGPPEPRDRGADSAAEV